MIRTAIYATTLAALVAVLGSAQAEGLAIKPGLWRTTTQMSNPMGPGMTTRTTEECVEETSFDPVSMLQDAEGCRITRNEVSENQVDFAMDCAMGGTQARVTGEFQSQSDTGSGHMNMNLNGEGMKMEMQMNWTSERLGDC